MICVRLPGTFLWPWEKPACAPSLTCRSTLRTYSTTRKTSRHCFACSQQLSRCVRITLHRALDLVLSLHCTHGVFAAGGDGGDGLVGDGCLAQKVDLPAAQLSRAPLHTRTSQVRVCLRNVVEVCGGSGEVHLQ